MKKFHQANLDETFICSKVGFSGRLLQVNIDSVILPNGRETTRELIHHPGAVAIVPILDDGSIIFVKQYRYPVGTVMYEIPAGKLGPGEEPDVCAERELSEETGYSAKEWQRLTSIVLLHRASLMKLFTCMRRAVWKNTTSILMKMSLSMS